MYRFFEITIEISDLLWLNMSFDFARTGRVEFGLWLVVGQGGISTMLKLSLAILKYHSFCSNFGVPEPQI